LRAARSSSSRMRSLTARSSCASALFTLMLLTLPPSSSNTSASTLSAPDAPPAGRPAPAAAAGRARPAWRLLPAALLLGAACAAPLGVGRAPGGWGREGALFSS
jgi:hypothetical protein